RLKTLARMEKIAPAHVDSPFHFVFGPPRKLPYPLLQLRDVAVGYGRQPILSRIRLDLSSGDRIGLLGINGAGKSTLIKLLAGELAPLTGEYAPSPDLRIGYFAQHQLEQLRIDESPLQHLLRLDPAARDQELRNFLGGFAFRGDMATSPVAPFSGGEKARLALALLVYQRPNLVLLDEPTNHLDLEMRHAIGLALQTYQGALIVISHDRHLLRSVTDTLLLVKNGSVQPFTGDLDDYRRMLATLSDDGSESAANETSSQSTNSNAARKERRRLEAEQREQLRPLREKLRQLDQTMDRLHAEKDILEERLADISLYEDAGKEQLKELLREQGRLSLDLERAEEAWMEVSEELESIQS
ncbi:MAG: ATP-binding cassette domain-containing protein, partial [Gammaproteobacteria bacterium]|nr:ATP-binding cassette domain-containing protein [Gammaproteobacteria bacterium]